MLVGLVLTVSLLSVGVANASNFRSEESITVSSSEVIESSLYAAGSNLRIDGTVKGDVFCAGQNVEINGTVEGDVLCAAQMIRIEGTVFGDVRIASQSITVGGAINGALTATGQSVHVSEGAVVGRDTTVFGESVVLANQNGRDVVAGASALTISGTIARNVEATAKAVTLEPTARVDGNLVYTSNENADAKAGAVVAGTVERKDPPKEAYRDDMVASYVIGPLYWFAALLVLGLAGLLVTPKLVEGPAEVLRRRPVASLGFGLAGLLATPILAVFLMATVVGLPLGVILLLLWAISLIGGFVVAAYCTGMLLVEKLGQKRWQRVLALTLGLLVLVIASALPSVGGLVGFAAIAWGMGSKLIWVHSHSMANTAKKPAKKA